MYKFLFFFFMIGAASIVYKSLERSYMSKTVIARVTLKTNCDLDPKAFAVRNMTLVRLENFNMARHLLKPLWLMS